MVQDTSKPADDADQAVNEVPNLIEEPPKDPAALLDPNPALATAQAVAAVQPPPPALAPPVLVPPTLKQDPNVFAHRQPAHDEAALVEVGEAMTAANEVFNRVKSEKIAEQTLCAIRNDQQQYEGLAKEIVGKAIKQKERERANRASAAASRAKVLRYQTELESRLNRVEAERNAFRREVEDLRHLTETPRKLGLDASHLPKLQDLIRKMEAANPQFVRSVIAQGEMDKLLGGEGTDTAPLDFEEHKEEGNDAKRRRL